MQIARQPRPGRPEAAQVALLMAQIGRLSISIARLREVPPRVTGAGCAEPSRPRFAACLARAPQRNVGAEVLGGLAS